MRIDVHVHVEPQPGFVDNLLRAMDRTSIDRAVLNGFVRYGDQSGNEAVAIPMQTHGDRIVGAAYFDLAVQTPGNVKVFHDRGFRALKFIGPPANYDDKRFVPVYDAAAELGMLCLFHTGIVSRSPAPVDRVHDVNNDRMRPIYLDTIARQTPALNIVGAHFGNPWYDEAAMAARWNPNLYWDLSGSTLKYRTAEDLSRLLWWTETSRYRDPLGRPAWQKIVFGSDVPTSEIGEVADDYRRALDALHIRDDIRAAIFGDTVAGLLGLA
jgi:predicted TIM-barrel fold metal-dependent hydrolase